MKNFNKILCIYLLLAVFISSNVFSQSECGTEDFLNGQAPYINDFFGGYLKPHRTDFDNGNPSQSDATLNMLFVFVQFQDENENSGEWEIDQPPTYMNKFLVEEKNSTGDFWNRYKDSLPSLVFQKVCFLYLNISKLFVQTFWSPTTILSPKMRYSYLYSFKTSI